jgi:SulP family sulfate permease
MSVLRDVSGGLLSALVGLPQVVPFGIMVFAPLGPSYLWLGIASGLLSAIVGSLVCICLSSIRTQISGPRAATVIVLASMVSTLVAHPTLREPDGGPAAAVIFVLVCIAVVSAGLLQILLGWLRVGQAIKLIPHPVLSGFLIGLGILLAVKQIPVILGQGVGGDWRSAFTGGALQPEPAIIAALTLGAIVAGSLWFRRVPSIATGFVVGCAVALAFSLITGNVGPVLTGAGHIQFPLLPVDGAVWTALLELLSDEQFVVTFFVYISVIALVSSIESLLALVAYDAATSNYSDSNRELLAQGLSNVVVGAVGGITSVGATVRTLTNHTGGGHSPLSVIVHSVAMATFLIYGSLLALIPQAVLAGIMLHVSINMIDWWPLRLIRDLAAPERRRQGQLGTLAVVILTAGVTVAFDSLIAVSVGIMSSIAVFARDMSRPIIRRISTGASMRSRTVRPYHVAEALAPIAGKTTIVQLDGPLFFGTAETARKWAEGVDPTETRQIVFDANRVLDIDITGANILGQTAMRLASKGIGTAICGLTEDDPRRRNLLDFTSYDPFVWFDDVDQALEWAENRLLVEANIAFDATAIPVGECSLLAGLSAEDLSRILPSLTQVRYPAKSTLFREGDEGSELFILTEGTVRIELQRGGRSIRLSTLAPGVTFGEMALLDQRPRSAHARAETPVVVSVLSHAALDQLSREAPAAAAALMQNLAREIAFRLRVTNTIVAGSIEN